MDFTPTTLLNLQASLREIGCDLGPLPVCQASDLLEHDLRDRFESGLSSSCHSLAL